MLGAVELRAERFLGSRMQLAEIPSLVLRAGALQADFEEQVIGTTSDDVDVLVKELGVWLVARTAKEARVASF